MRYALTLSYDGSGFYGWQIQPHERSIQETLQQALGTLLGCEIAVTGAGRTDTDVNAFEYIAHFDYVGVLPYECADFIFKLNAILPQEICILDLREVDSDFHARFDACKRTYHYFIHFKKDPFVRHYSWYCKYKLDVEAMQRACQYLIGTQDFACFEKKGADSKTTLCTLYEAKWEFYRPSLQSVCGKDGGESYLCFTVSANRFLRNMVRAIVGTMIEIGRGRMKAEDLPEVLASKNRCRAGQSVPGNALFLTKVEY